MFNTLDGYKDVWAGGTTRLLRDLRESTTLLILLAVTTERHTRLKSLANELGMTIQGASEYIRRMIEEGLLHVVDDEYRATRKGVEFLQERFRELKAWVDRAQPQIAFVEVTAALAGAPIRSGQRVGLFMEQGLLVARPDVPSPSTGVAASDAGKGEVLAVRGLEGIVGLRPGRIIVGRLPPIRDGRPRPLTTEAARKLARKAKGAVVAVLDVAGTVAARQLGRRPQIEFAALSGSIEAAERGVNVLLLVPEERAAEALEAIEGANARLEDKIPYESIAVG